MPASAVPASAVPASAVPASAVPASAVTAAMRTPWAPRHRGLSEIDPTTLLAAAMEAARAERDLDPGSIDLLLVACDTTVGAQAINIARRAALQLGWHDVAALTVDGQRAGGLALVGLAAARSATTMIAAVDCTTTVPPGADLVRDYGRPRRFQSEIEELEALAEERGISRGALDEVATAMRLPPSVVSPAITPVRDRTRSVESDELDSRTFQELEPLTAHGVQTAWHLAEYADGAVAMVVEPETEAGRAVSAATFAGSDPTTVTDSLEKLVRNADAEIIMAEPSAVVMSAVGLSNPHPLVASPIALGSGPASDGLRCLADAWHLTDESTLIVSRGDHGQLSTVTLSPPS